MRERVRGAGAGLVVRLLLCARGRSAMAEKLLDCSQPFDVGLLDATVAAFYGTGSKEEVHFCD